MLPKTSQNCHQNLTKIIKKIDWIFGVTATMRHTSSDECTVILMTGVKQYGAALKEEALRQAPYPGPYFGPQYTRKLGMAVE